MRPLAALCCFALSCLSLAQRDDPRLKSPLTFDEPYLSLSTLGTAIEKASGVKITVERAIADRKVSVFATGRPLGEVMTRVAETLYLEWQAEGEGYRLRLKPEVAKEERAAAAFDDQKEREEILRDIRACIAEARRPLEEFRAAYQRARAEYDASTSDRSEEGRRRSAELMRELYRRWPDQDKRERWDRGRALGQLSESQLSALLSGQPFFASSNGIPGTFRLASDAGGLLADMGFRSSEEPKDLLLTMWYDPSVRAVQFRYRTLGLSNGAMSTSKTLAPLNDYYVLQELGTLALVKRLNEWAKVRDEAVLATRFSRDATPPKPGRTGLVSLGQSLRWMHQKTGIPIVADAFRVAAGYADFPTAGTVGDYVKKLTTPETGYFTVIPPYVRSEDGWLMARHRRYWRRLRAEVPERILRPLEAKAATGRLTLDDYAGLAASMTPEQAANATAVGGFLVDFPIHALRSSIPALRLWAALPSGSRQAAQRNGIPVRSLNGQALVAARGYVADLILNGFPDESWLPALLPGGDGIPSDTTLTIRYDSKGERVRRMNDEWVRRVTEPYSAFPTPFEGWVFELVRPPDFRFSTSVALHPQAAGR